MKTIFVLSILIAFSYSSSPAQELNFPPGNMGYNQIAYPMQRGYYMPYAPPPVIYQPQMQIQWQPLQYQGSTYQPKFYRTPIRNWLFGTGTINHYYSPQQQ